MRNNVLFVDGYNMIGSWPHLVQLKRLDRLQEARDILITQLSNYGKYRHTKIILVFDAQFVPGEGEFVTEQNIHIVFTEEGETADQYIERHIRNYLNALTRVVVATSDATEQWVVFQQGALRFSADELYVEINNAKKEIHKDIKQHYNQSLRRRSPWHPEQLTQLGKLLKDLDKDA